MQIRRIIPEPLKEHMRKMRAIWRRLLLPPLESLPDCPDLFKGYRYLNQNPALKRVAGGWAYKDRFYPDYLTVGGQVGQSSGLLCDIAKGEELILELATGPCPVLSL